MFADSRPSLRELWASRTGSFDRAHCILPSDAVVGESTAVTIQVWDEYERLHPSEAVLALDSTDPDATHPDEVRLTPVDAGFVRGSVSFETPGVHYLTLTHEPSGERFVSNPVRGHTTAPLERVTVVKDNEPWHVVEGTDDHDAPADADACETRVVDDAPVTGMAWDDDRGTEADVYYLRVEQASHGPGDDVHSLGGAAWAGPLWVTADGTAAGP